MRSNRELWNNLARVHFHSKFYDVPGFLKGKSSLNPIDLQVLGDVRGKSVLHLQCHFGKDTLSLARMGAVVTGVDFSEVAIEKARELKEASRLDARFIHCDVNHLDESLDKKFDIVYASFGVIGWHSDLGNWARIVSRFMKKKGKFCFAEFHPVLWMLSDDHSKIEYSYFKSDPIVGENEKSYADPESKNLGTSHCWNHSLGELFGALESHGLIIKDFKEYDFSPYATFPDAIEKNGRYYIKGLEHKLPLTYSLTAIKKA
ncbi:class I SAM-dependent methyltransferase [Pedosphaera parvula]|uniref:class I SAM-dependent methyltransferase n=1 Tax=Pedosphaera parvula TaxID=1032527 RepID=UPI0002D8EBA6|nr:class I SAM-dependent methyltransferase [Pedosphaera parvula]